MKKKWITFFFCILIFLLACSVLFNKVNNEKKDTKKIRLSEVTHSIFYTPLYVADSLGYFEENGIDLEIITSSGADAVAAAVLSGDVDLGFCGSEQSIYIYNQGKTDYLVNFAGLTKRDGSFLVARKKMTSLSLEDLKGKTIIGGRQGGMPAMTLAYTLYEKGVNPKTEVNIDTSIAFASMSGAFISGVGDYVTLFEPNALQLERQKKGYVVASIGKLGGEVPYTTFQAKKSYIKENPTIIKGFHKALQKGLDYTYTHSEKEIANVIKNYFSDTSIRDLTEVIKRYKENDSWYRTTYIPKSGFERVQDIMTYNNVLDKRVSYHKLVDTDYAQK